MTGRCLRAATMGIAAVLLSACLVDGADVSPADLVYDGLETPMALTTGNVDETAQLVFLQAYDADDFTVLAGLQGAAGPAATARGVANVARALASLSTSRRPRVEQTAQSQRPATCSGGTLTSAYTTDPDLDDPPETYDLTFDNYCVDGLLGPGTRVFHGRVVIEKTPLAGGEIHFLITLDQFHVGATVIDGEVVFTDRPSALDLTLDLVVAAARQVPYRFQNFSVSFTAVSDGRLITLAGRFYHPERGYLAVSTDTPFLIADGDAWPSQGQLTLTGADNGVARLTANGDALSHALEADFDADGVVDYGPADFTWQPQAQFQNFL